MVAAAFVVVGLAVFAVVGDAAAGNDTAPGWEWAIAIVVLCALTGGLLLVGGRASLAQKAGAYGACAGVLYGLSASLWKPSGAILAADGLGGMLASWEFWVFAAAGIFAFLVQQVSLATGQLAPSVAMTAVVNPVVCIAVGTLVLEERLASPTWHKAVAYAGLALALVAAMAITRSTEDAKAPTDVAPAPAAS
jgi:hypothetical protein